MHLDIEARKFALTDALSSYVKRRLRVALTSAGNHVQRTFVRLSGINGPRGREDKCCQLRVVLAGLPDVVVEDTEADLYFAIDRAGRAVMRKIELKQTRLKHNRRLDWDLSQPG